MTAPTETLRSQPITSLFTCTGVPRLVSPKSTRFSYGLWLKTRKLSGTPSPSFFLKSETILPEWAPEAMTKTICSSVRPPL